MSFATASLEGYFTKCGAPDYDASLVASLFGEPYTQLNNHYRASGLSNPKAHAAIYICTQVLNDSDNPTGLLSLSVGRIEDMVEALRIFRAVGVCKVAVHAYALQEDESSSILEQYQKAVASARKEVDYYGIGQFPDPIIPSYKQELQTIAIGSMALGKRKGFFSKIFG